MAGVGMAARLPHGFADRGGDQSVQRPSQGETYAVFDIAIGGVPSGASGMAGDTFGLSELGKSQDGETLRVGWEGVANLPLMRAEGRRQTGRRFL